MTGTAAPRFWAGDNLAMKVPAHEYPRTVAFYRDVLGLTPIDSEAPAVVFEFGGKRLWLDRVEQLSQAEIWLEIRCDDLERAQAYLQAQGVVRCDRIEALPAGFQGFWIASPADIIHLVSRHG